MILIIKPDLDDYSLDIFMSDEPPIPREDYLVISTSITIPEDDIAFVRTTYLSKEAYRMILQDTKLEFSWLSELKKLYTLWYTQEYIFTTFQIQKDIDYD